MAMVEFEDGAIQVDVIVVAEGLGIEPALVQEGIRKGGSPAVARGVLMRMKGGIG